MALHGGCYFVLQLRELGNDGGSRRGIVWARADTGAGVEARGCDTFPGEGQRPGFCQPGPRRLLLGGTGRQL